VGEDGVDDDRPERGEDHEGAERIRSTTAPAIRATVMMQKVPWKGHEQEVGDRPFAARFEADVLQREVAEAAEQRAFAVEGERVAEHRPGEAAIRSRRCTS
jgi:hypothetical protein